MIGTQPRTTAVRYALVGIAATLLIAGCSSSQTSSGTDTPSGGGARSSPPTGSTSTSTPAGKVKPPAPNGTPTAIYKPATEEGPAENVPVPAMPEAARQQTSAGLQEFAKYWYSLINYGFETGDLAPLKEVSGPDCVVCSNVYELLELGYDEDDWVVGGRLEALGTQTNFTLTSKGLYQVLIQIRQDEYEYRGPGNHVYEVNKGLDSTTVQMIEANYHHGQWFAVNAVTVK